MKKIIVYVLLFISLSFIGIYKVNADLECKTKRITLSEEQAVNAQFETVVTLCTDPVFDHYNGIKTGSKYPDVKAYAYEMVGVTWTNADNKSFGSGYVPRCDDNLAKMDAVLEAYYYKKGTPKYGTKPECSDICSRVLVEDACNTNYCTWNTTGQSCNGLSANCLRWTDRNTCLNHSGCSWKTTGTCNKVYDYCVEVEDTTNIVDYSCPDGCSKDTTESVDKLICKCRQDKKFAQECLNKNYTIGAGGKCVPGNAGEWNLIQKDPTSVIKSYNNHCNSSWDGAHFPKPCQAENIEYTLYCPVYKCTVKDKLISACTPSFSVDGNDAYCVNPGNTIGSKYEEDNSFDVTKCKNSFNTVDCGYGNILIEEKYYETDNDNNTIISSKATELAMRLWGAHTGQDGFDGSVGLSLRQGAGCGDGAWYIPKNGYFQNVYQNTYNFIMNEMFEDIHKKITNGYLDPVNVGDKYNIDCPGTPGDVVNPYTKYSVACGGNKEYQKGIALFFNTLLGNSKMQDHLYSINPGSRPHDPIYASLEYNTEKNETTAVVWFEEEEYEEIFNKTQTDEISCDCLADKSKCKKGEYEKYEPYYNDIAPYCQTKTIFIDSKGVIGPSDGKRMEKCLKGSGCISHSSITGNVICQQDIVERVPTKIKTKYTETTITNSIVKYAACGAVSSNQLLYAFKNSTIQAANNKKVYVDVETSKLTGEKTFEVSPPYNCDGNCTEEDSKVQEDVNKSCENNSENFNGYYSSSVKDPSLKCIVNMGQNSNKSNYDYSEFFHVNTDLCRIYCSDEIEYQIADKVRETSARNFKYDIREGSDVPLSAVIKEKRTCVSKINYHDIRESIESLRRRYDLNSKELPTLIKLADGQNPPAGVSVIKSGNTRYRPANFFDLVLVLYNKAVGSGGYKGENKRGENINQLIYDLYNCNLYSSNGNNFGETKNDVDSAPGNIIKKPEDNKTGNVRDYIEKTFSAPKNTTGSEKYVYGIDQSNCKITVKNGKITGNTCISHDPMKYGFAPQVDAANSGVEMGSMSLAHASVDEIKYCSGTGCFDYKKDAGKKNYTYGNGTTTNKVNTKDYNFSALRGINFGKINVPTNDYAYFDIEVEVGFFNNNVFEVEPDTGLVYKDSSDHDYLINEEYTYPTDKLSYNKEACNKTTLGGTDISNASKSYKRCEISQTFSKVSTFFRKKFSDDFKNIVNESRTFNCYVDVTQPMLDKYYRNVDPSDLHPDGVPIGTNWSTTRGKNVEAYVEKYSSGIGIDESILDYSITLTPQQIKNLKEYNSLNPTNKYVNDPVISKTCQCKSDVKDITKKECLSRLDSYYVECESGFLNLIRNGSKDEKSSYATIVKDGYPPKETEEKKGF